MPDQDELGVASDEASGAQTATADAPPEPPKAAPGTGWAKTEKLSTIIGPDQLLDD